MNTHTSISTVVVSAVVLVILPLLAVVGAIAAHTALAAAGGDGMGMFAHMGLTQIVLLGWSVLAAGVVTALIAALVREHTHA